MSDVGGNVIGNDKGDGMTVKQKSDLCGILPPSFPSITYYSVQQKVTLTTVRAFTPWKLATATNQGF